MKFNVYWSQSGLCCFFPSSQDFPLYTNTPAATACAPLGIFTVEWDPLAWGNHSLFMSTLQLPTLILLFTRIPTLLDKLTVASGNGWEAYGLYCHIATQCGDMYRVVQSYCVYDTITYKVQSSFNSISLKYHGLIHKSSHRFCIAHNYVISAPQSHLKELWT